MRFDNTPLDFDTIPKKLQKAAELLLPYKDKIVALLLFGSAHSQTTTPLSDIDLAVFTRITEFKHIHPVETKKTVILKEYPKAYKVGMNIPYYPIFKYGKY